MNYDLKPNSKKTAEISGNVVKLISILKATSENRKFRYIRHNIDNHNNVPLWVLINALSFGNVSKMYSLNKQSVQSKICNEYCFVSPKEMENILSILTKFRNVCAHNERLYNYKTEDTLPKMPIHKKLNLPLNKNKSTYTKGTDDFFAVIISLKCLLTDSDFKLFFDDLSSLISSFEFKTNIINKLSVLSEMGFPQNWQDIAKMNNEK